MTVTSSAKLSQIAALSREDAKTAHFNAVGAKNVEGFQVFHNLVLVATYIRPETTKGGIIRPDRNLAEDRFQGKVGLVLKVGPIAFKDDNVNKFGGRYVKPGDWVVYRASDGHELYFVDESTGRDGTPCRLLEDIHIKGRVEAPESVF